MADVTARHDPIVFLDANASAPLVDEARLALIDALSLVGNPSSPHRLGRAARRLVDDARAHVARALGGVPSEVVFGSGASEANRFVADSLARLADARGRPLAVAASNLEHPSLARPLTDLAERGRITLHPLFVDERGRVAEADLARVDVICVTAAHHETGIVPDVVALLRSLPDDTIACTDASQAVARRDPVDARFDLVVCSGHKMGAPAGVGALLRRGRARALPAPWQGGGQEAGLRPGTESVALVAALGAAARVVDDTRARHARLASLRDRFEAIVTAGIDDVRVVGASAERLPQTSALSFGGVDGEALRIAVDRRGLMVSFGAACSALAPEPSRALLSLGLDAARARATVRVSLPQDADVEAVTSAAHVLVEVARALRRR